MLYPTEIANEITEISFPLDTIKRIYNDHVLNIELLVRWHRK